MPRMRRNGPGAMLALCPMNPLSVVRFLNTVIVAEAGEASALVIPDTVDLPDFGVINSYPRPIAGFQAPPSSLERVGGCQLLSAAERYERLDWLQRTFWGNLGNSAALPPVVDIGALGSAPLLAILSGRYGNDGARGRELFPFGTSFSQGHPHMAAVMVALARAATNSLLRSDARGEALIEAAAQTPIPEALVVDVILPQAAADERRGDPSRVDDLSAYLQDFSNTQRQQIQAAERAVRGIDSIASGEALRQRVALSYLYNLQRALGRGTARVVLQPRTVMGAEDYFGTSPAILQEMASYRAEMSLSLLSRLGVPRRGGYMPLLQVAGLAEQRLEKEYTQAEREQADMEQLETRLAPWNKTYADALRAAQDLSGEGVAAVEEELHEQAQEQTQLTGKAPRELRPQDVISAWLRYKVNPLLFPRDKRARPTGLPIEAIQSLAITVYALADEREGYQPVCWKDYSGPDLRAMVAGYQKQFESWKKRSLAALGRKRGAQTELKRSEVHETSWSLEKILLCEQYDLCDLQTHLRYYFEAKDEGIPAVAPGAVGVAIFSLSALQHLPQWGEIKSTWLNKTWALDKDHRVAVVRIRRVLDESSWPSAPGDITIHTPDGLPQADLSVESISAIDLPALVRYFGHSQPVHHPHTGHWMLKVAEEGFNVFSRKNVASTGTFQRLVQQIKRRAEERQASDKPGKRTRKGIVPQSQADVEALAYLSALESLIEGNLARMSDVVKGGRSAAVALHASRGREKMGPGGRRHPDARTFATERITSFAGLTYAASSILRDLRNTEQLHFTSPKVSEAHSQRAAILQALQRIPGLEMPPPAGDSPEALAAWNDLYKDRIQQLQLLLDSGEYPMEVIGRPPLPRGQHGDSAHIKRIEKQIAKLNPASGRGGRARRPRRQRYREARQNPLDPDQIAAVRAFLADPQNPLKQQAADAALSGASPADITAAVAAFFPRQAPTAQYRLDKRLSVLSESDLTGHARPRSSDPQRDSHLRDDWPLQPDDLSYLRGQSELSVQEAARLLATQHKARQSKSTIYPSSAVCKQHRRPKLRYSPPMALMMASPAGYGDGLAARKCVLWLSPEGANPLRVMTLRRGVHIDCDFVAGPGESTGKVLGRAIQSQVLWLAEKPSRQLDTYVYIGRVGESTLHLAWQPRDEVSFEQFFRRLGERQTLTLQVHTAPGKVVPYDGVADVDAYRAAARLTPVSAEHKYVPPRKQETDPGLSPLTPPPPPPAPAAPGPDLTEEREEPPAPASPPPGREKRSRTRPLISFLPPKESASAPDIEEEEEETEETQSPEPPTPAVVRRSSRRGEARTGRTPRRKTPPEESP